MPKSHSKHTTSTSKESPIEVRKCNVKHDNFANQKPIEEQSNQDVFQIFIEKLYLTQDNSNSKELNEQPDDIFNLELEPEFNTELIDADLKAILAFHSGRHTLNAGNVPIIPNSENCPKLNTVDLDKNICDSNGSSKMKKTHFTTPSMISKKLMQQRDFKLKKSITTAADRSKTTENASSMLKGKNPVKVTKSGQQTIAGYTQNRSTPELQNFKNLNQINILEDITSTFKLKDTCNSQVRPFYKTNTTTALKSKKTIPIAQPSGPKNTSNISEDTLSDNMMDKLIASGSLLSTFKSKSKSITGVIHS